MDETRAPPDIPPEPADSISADSNPGDSIPVDIFFKLLGLSRRRGIKDRSRYLKRSRERLAKFVSARLSTAFIGALAAVEEVFGELWGHGKPKSEKTREEIAWELRWAKCRERILKTGNNQKRAVDTELTRYHVEWKRHTVVMEVKPPEPNTSAISGEGKGSQDG